MVLSEKILNLDQTRSDVWVQCELYHRARLAGLQVKVEVRLSSSVHRSKSFRVDVLLFKDGVPKLACEAKGFGNKQDWSKLKTRQAKAYADCGVPCMLVRSEADIEEAIRIASN